MEGVKTAGHIFEEMAREVASEMISSFSPQEQREMLGIINHLINENYSEIIQERRKDLELAEYNQKIFTAQDMIKEEPVESIENHVNRFRR